MEVPDWTKVLLNRLQMFEPENAIKIMGFLLLNYTQQDIIECALGPDNLIHALINKAKSFLSSSPKLMPLSPLQPHLDHLIPIQHMPMSPTISRQCSSPSSFRVLAPSPSLEPQVVSEQQHIMPNLDVANPLVSELIAEDLRLRNQAEIIGLEDRLNQLSPLPPGFPSNYIYQDAALAGVMGSGIGLTSPPNLPEHSRACHYFHKGYCRNGANCRYFHGQAVLDIFSQMHSMEANELLNDDHIFSPGSVEKLELEIRELLKARNGLPVSIAALPMLYQEKYGRPLQADGYLTESQRHGKTGFSLTRLLARLKNSIRVVDRPHGQHSVVLSEDVAKYVEFRNERSDSLQASSSSSQIYLTFPADSTFTEEDVLKYFNQFGPVRDVRIPRQEKRMFGFVSFVLPETVRAILAKGHPHFICGSRVLVKPYKEKPRLNDRKYAERIEHPIYQHYQHFEMDHDCNAMPAVYDNSRSFRRLTEEQERAIDLESRRLLELHISPTRTQNFVFSHRKEASRHSEVVRDNSNCLPLFANKEPRSEDEPTQRINNHNEQDSDYIELPDSPFASPH